MKVNKVDSITTKIIKPTKRSAKKAVAQKVAKKIEPKKYPNWLGLLGENYGNNVGYKVAYYPEDIEKMKSMTDIEVADYKAKLRAQGKCYKYTSPIVLSDKLAAILGDLSQYEVK